MAAFEAFEFSTAGKIVFGRGCATKNLAQAVAGVGGSRVFLVHGGSDTAKARISALVSVLPVVASLGVGAEPTTDTVYEGVRLATGAKADVVVAIGGGSVIDTAKAVAGVAASGGELLDFLEGIGRGRALTGALPVVAVPTTAGTGSECTRNAVVCSRKHAVKVSLRSDLLLPRVALVDPLLTLTVPANVTRDSGLDALVQCIEPFVCNKRTPFTDALCKEGIARAARSLPLAVAQPGNVSAREDMCVAATISGICLANARLGLAHGFAGPLGGLLDEAPHGALCAAVIPHVVSANIAALRQLQPQTDETSTILGRYAEIARIVGASDTTPEGCAAWLVSFCHQLQVQTLSKLGLKRDQIPMLVEKVSRASSTRGNPVTLTLAQLESIAVASL